MTTLVEGTHPGGFLVWEAFRDYTRELELKAHSRPELRSAFSENWFAHGAGPWCRVLEK